MRSSFTGRWLVRTLLLVAACSALWRLPVRAQDPQPAPPAAEIDAESARQQQIVDRFLTVLERNPRRGTALDRIYGFHVENGTLETFAQSLRERTAKTPDDGVGWMILGLVESQRGRDAAAVEAFTKAKQLRATDAMSAFYLGQSLVLVGQPEKAATAFEEAIARKPPRVDLLEIFQALGRVHQRAQRPEEALAVWSRLEKLFPGDGRVQEQIAITLVEEGQLAQALPRYEALAKTTTDDYRRTIFRVEAAELKVKLNRASEGIADLEQVLAQLNPESWLFREVRRKIEDVFLRTGDQDGLATYYAKWLEKNKEDVDAMARLGRVLARQARVPEAQVWLDKALKLAPSRKELRLAFIEQLVDDGRFPEAIQQYVALDKADPNNPDYLREWGKLVLRDTSRPKEERAAEAERIWRRLQAARPTDPLVTTQVADLLRHAGISGPALALYEKAVELAPKSPQYREYLGEYYHLLKRPEDALATWRQIAAGDLRTAENLARLAEVLAQFGYLKEAQPEIAAACELAPKDYSLQLKAADLQIRGELYDEALASLARGETLAQNDEEREAILAQQIKTFTLQNKLADLAEELEKQVAADATDARSWFLLARYREALRQWPEATKAIGESLKLQAGSIPSLAAAARIAEQSGDLSVSADYNRKLALVDRRSRSDYLERVAQLETQLGRTDAALAAGRDLIAAAPGNVETYQFFSDLCMRLGQPDDGIAALRRATRVNPNDPNILLSLAAALGAQFRTDEAIELYWQAFEKGTELDDKLSVIGKLTELHLQINRLDQLLERLERGRREDDRRREMTICLAQAYHSAGDYGMARQELERLLSENSRDTQLLLQLSKLAESESDLSGAVKFQEQLARLAPGAETEYRLATLLSQSGSPQEAAAILVRLAVKEEDKEKLLRNVDSLLAGDQKETALAVLEPKLRENPTDWELLYREGLALSAAKPEEAARRFEAILGIALPDEELSAAGKARHAAQRRTGGAAASASREVLSRLDYAYQVQAAVGLNSERYYSGTTSVWTPQNFGQARMAAIGWLYRFAQDDSKSDEFVAARRAIADRAEATSRELWDWAYLQQMRSETGDMQETSKRLARMGDVAGRYLFISQLASRNSAAFSSAGGAPQAADRTPPLSAEDLELLTDSLSAVEQALVGQANASAYSRSLRQTVMAELRRAGRKEDEEKLYQQIVTASDTTEQLMAAFQMASWRGDLPAATSLLNRFAQKDLQTNDTKSLPARQARASMGSSVGMLVGGAQIQPAEILGVLDRYLDYSIAWTNQQRNNPLNRSASRAPSLASSSYSYVYVGGTRRRVGGLTPAATGYLDTYAMSVLRTALEQFKHKDLTSDFLKHLEQRAAAAAEGDKVYAILALGYARLWNDELEAGLETLTKAVELVPQDVELRMSVAALLVQSQRLDDALAMLDAVTPLDQRVLQQQETLALDIAVRLGDQERARAAAQRLFGLRLTPELQVQLAGQMRRLGMGEEADAVIARAQRQAGNRTSALAALMGQYQSEGRMDVAVQAAYQILRRSRTLSAAQQAMGISTADSSYRRSALGCLSQAGKLKELIAVLESQIERSPQATQLYETLSEYYQAAGDVEKQLAIQAKIVELRPDDAELRYRYAGALRGRGKHAEACDQYRIALLKQPRLLENRYYEVSESFRTANREAELVKLLNEIDLRRLGQPYIAINLISNLMNNESSKPAAMELLKKAWEAFPSYRSQLMSSFYRADVWATPEMFAFGKQSILPTADAVRQNPWYGIGDVVSYSSNGTVNTSLSYLLDAAEKNNQLAAIRDEVAGAITEQPAWQAGPAILALIDVRLSRPIEPQTAFAALLATAPGDYRMQNTRWIVGQEMAKRQEWHGVALDLLKLATTDPTNSSSRQFQYGPASSYVRLCAKLGKKEEARQVLAEWSQPNRQSEYYSSDPLYNTSRRMEDLAAIGQLAQELDFPVEGMRVYRELMINAAYSDPQLQQWSGRNPAAVRQRAERGIESITAKLADDPGGQVALSLLAPLADPPEGAPAIDLMLAVPATPLARLDSALARMLKPQSLIPEAAASLDGLLVSLAQKYPRDITVRIVQTLVALRRADAAAGERAVRELAEFVVAHPLEEIAAEQRPNSRQRQEAMQQVGLWLVVRECQPRPELREPAVALADRALEGARRQVETSLVVAILYEKALVALEAGDRQAAERELNQLIDLVLVQPRLLRPRSVAAPMPAAVRQPMREAPPARAVPERAPVVRTGGPIPATVSQFSLAAALAEGAAEKGLTDVSLRAIREALSGGLPVPDMPVSGLSSGQSPVRIYRPSIGSAGRPDLDNSVLVEVSNRMWQLSAIWRQHRFPPAEVSTLLEALVLPPSRPGDVLLYEQRVNDNWTSPRSVGRLLVDWAIRAGRVQAVRDAIAKRTATPSDVLAGQVLLVQLHVAVGETRQARERLREIVRLLEGPQPAALATASHAAGVALADPQLADDAMPILAKISATPGARTVNYNASEGGDPLVRVLVRHALEKQDPAAAKEHLEKYLAWRQPVYGQYGGDYGLTIQRMDLAFAAGELARAGDVRLSLEALARFSDAPSRGSDVQSTVLIWRQARQLLALPAAERYELLRDWTLPTDDRRTLRLVGSFSGGQQVPTAFLPAAERQGLRLPNFEPISNFTLLVESAAQAGRLAELSAAIGPLVAEKLPGAEGLAALVEMAQRDFAAARPRLDAIRAALQAQAREEQADANRPGGRQEIKPVSWSDYLAAHVALKTPQVAGKGRLLMNQVAIAARRSSNSDLQVHAAYDLARFQAAQVGINDLRSLESGQLALWQPSNSAVAADHSQVPRVWVAHESLLAHVTGSGGDQLFLKTPLAGEFQLSCDAWFANPSPGGVGFAGLSLLHQYRGVYMSAASGHEVVNKSPPAIRMEGWNRIELRVAPERVQYLLNGHPIYDEAAPSGTSPWVYLAAPSGSQFKVKNVRIHGQPVVPREVRLVDGERFDGWSAATFGERLPKRLTKDEPRPDYEYYDPFDGGSARQREPAPDWTAKGGELLGRADPLAAADAQSRLDYHRPLQDGDRIRYEFFYEPGLTHVHPALGRMAFLLTEEGVRLHWMSLTDETAGEPISIDPRNLLDDAEARRGPDKLPLKPNEWNQVELALTGDEVSLSLGGVEILRRAVEPTSDRRFGLFRYKSQTTARVRNVVLTGNWPAELSSAEQADLLVPATAATPSEQLARHKIIGEEIFTHDAYAVWRRSQTLALEERYKLLTEWVLPSSQHPTFRLRADFSPTDPVTTAEHSPAGERIRVGGEIVSPAAALVRTAAELDRLDELSRAIESAAALPAVTKDQRSMLALQLLIDIARQDDAAAGGRLKQLATLARDLPPHIPVHQRHVDLVAVRAALDRPALQPDALALAEQLATTQFNKGALTTQWLPTARRLLGLAKGWNDPSAGDRTHRATPPELTQWLAVSHPTAESRGAGEPPPSWRFERGRADYLTGSGHDGLYFRSPLSGDFEVRCQISTPEGRQMYLLYGGVRLALAPDGTSLRRSRPGQAEAVIPFAEKTAWGEWIDLRLVVKGGGLTVFVAEKQVHAERLPMHLDPWLAIRSAESHYLGGVRNVRIVGSPTIPPDVRIFGGSDLAGGLAEYFGESIGDEGAAWTKTGEEVVGRSIDNAKGSFRESLLQYHRPLAEDSTVEYEFFYEPGNAEVHPALDRLVFLLDQAGPRLHWLTCGAHEREGLVPDNSRRLDGARPVPLKSREWNKAQLTLAGDEVTIAVNGQEVARRRLERANLRTLGWFHYADVATARIRNVVYRGQWPTDLLSGKQELDVP